MQRERTTERLYVKKPQLASVVAIGECEPTNSIAAAIATMSVSSTSVTVDMGKLNTVPKQAQRIVRLASRL